MYIRPPSYSSRRASSFNQAVFLFSSSLLLTSVLLLSAIVWWNRCPHDLDRSLAFRLLSVDPLFISFHLSLSCSPSLVLGRHFHPRSTCLRYTGDEPAW